MVTAPMTTREFMALATREIVHFLKRFALRWQLSSSASRMHALQALLRSARWEPMHPQTEDMIAVYEQEIDYEQQRQISINLRISELQ